MDSRGTGVRMRDRMAGAASRLQHHISCTPVQSETVLNVLGHNMLDCLCVYPALYCGSGRDHVSSIFCGSTFLLHSAVFCVLFSCCLHLTPPDQSFFFRFLTILLHLVEKCRPVTSFRASCVLSAMMSHAMP